MGGAYRPTNQIGPRSGFQCRTCTHPNRTDIDHELRRAVLSNREIAAQFGFSRHSVDRHVRHGHVPPDSSGNAVGSPYRPNVLVDFGDNSSLGILRQSLHALQKVDPATLSPAAMLGYQDAIRRTVESLSKLEPQLRTSVALSEVKGMDAFIGILFRHLEAHPDTREAIFADLHAAEAEGAFELAGLALPPGSAP